MRTKSSRVVKYQRVKEILANDIEEGKYNLGDRLPSEKQLAEQFEVSIITIRQAVEALARDGYVEKIQGSGTYVRHLRPVIERKVWGFVIPNLKDYWYPPVAQGMEEVARTAGIDLVISGVDTGGDPGEDVRRLVAMGVEALAIAPSFRNPLDATICVELSMAGLPFVFCGDYVEGVNEPRVLWDCQGGGRLATEHLMDLGHTRIAFLSHPATHTSAEIWAGHTKALQEAGLEPRPPRGLYADSYQETDTYRAARELLAAWPRATAVICTNDEVAYHVCRAAQDAGISIPDEFSVVGFYGFHMDVAEDCFLTTVAVPKYELGQEAGKILLRLMMGGSVNPEVVLPARLRPGRTTAPPVESDVVRPSASSEADDK